MRSESGGSNYAREAGIRGCVVVVLTIVVQGVMFLMVMEFRGYRSPEGSRCSGLTGT